MGVVHGELLAPDGAEIVLYVSDEIHEVLASIVAGVEDPLGSVVLRIVSDDEWPGVRQVAEKAEGGRLVAPTGAVALDLMDSGDPRHWVAAENTATAEVLRYSIGTSIRWPECSDQGTGPLPNLSRGER